MQLPIENSGMTFSYNQSGAYSRSHSLQRLAIKSSDQTILNVRSLLVNLYLSLLQV